MSYRRPDILLVEDNEIDVMSFLRQVKREDFSRKITVCDTGEGALELLLASDSKDGVAPFVVVTDIKMPGISGHELIETIRRQTTISNTVAFVISTSDMRADRARAYSNKVAGYFIKDDRDQSLVRCVRMLREYCDGVAI